MRSWIVCSALTIVLLSFVAGCAAPAAPRTGPVTSNAASGVAPPATPLSPVGDSTSSAAQSSTAPVKVRTGVIGLTGEAGLFLAQERGYFREEGLDVDFELLRGGAEAMPPLATGAPDPSLFNATRRDVGVKLISSLQILLPDDAGAALVIRQDHLDSGRFRELRDLKGMTIGIRNLGTTPQLYMERVLARGGLSVDDVQFNLLGYTDMPVAMANRVVDAAWIVEPFVAVTEGQGIGKSAIYVGEVFPGAVPMILLLSPVFEQQQPEAVRRFTIAFLRGQRDYYQALRSEGGVAQITPVLQKYTPLQDQNLIARMAMSNVDPNGTLDRRVLDTMQDYFVKSGTQQEKQDLTRVIDTTYIDYAVGRLGRVAP
jgi:NitT/TauT family transport system substrate-binding protein